MRETVPPPLGPWEPPPFALREIVARVKAVAPRGYMGEEGLSPGEAGRSPKKSSLLCEGQEGDRSASSGVGGRTERGAWKALPFWCFPWGQLLILKPQSVEHNSLIMVGESELSLTIDLIRKLVWVPLIPCDYVPDSFGDKGVKRSHVGRAHPECGPL